jgi:hypothetical protein
MQTLADHNVPIPIRMWVAAGGLDFHDLLEGLQQDVVDRQQLQKYDTVQQGIEGKGGEGVDEIPEDEQREEYEGQYNDDQGRDRETKPIMQRQEGASFHSARSRSPRGLLSRDWSQEEEISGRTRTGKKKHIINQAAASRKANEAIARAVEKMQDPSYYDTIRGNVDRRMIANMLGTKGK